MSEKNPKSFPLFGILPDGQRVEAVMVSFPDGTSEDRGVDEEWVALPPVSGNQEDLWSDDDVCREPHEH